MKASYPLRGLGVTRFMALIWLGLLAPLEAEEPKITQNSDGTSTKTEKVDFGRKPRKDSIGGDMRPRPFFGPGEKRTTVDKDGNITKVDWVRTGKQGGERPNTSVFVERNPNNGRTTITTIHYGDDGKPTGKNQDIYSKDGDLVYSEYETNDKDGNVTYGTKQSYDGWDEGKKGDWKSQRWNPSTEKWEPDPYGGKPAGKKLDQELKDLETKWGQDKFPRTVTGLPLSSDNFAFNISGTGETVGHVAMIAIENRTDQPQTCAIPAMILESRSRKNQHYGCPYAQKLFLKPHQKRNVPVEGVCLNRNKPPCPKGQKDDLVINDGSATDGKDGKLHLSSNAVDLVLRKCRSRHRAIQNLVSDGDSLKDFPYKDKKKQKEILMQWSTWTDPEICQMTDAPTATKDDLKKVVYKQIEEKGPMPPETKKKVDQGIDTIFENVELTSEKAKDLEKQDDEESEEKLTEATM